MAKKDEPFIEKVKQLFVILDRFNRNQIYGQFGYTLDFTQETERFCRILNEIPEENIRESLKIQMDFLDYKGKIKMDLGKSVIEDKLTANIDIDQNDTKGANDKLNLLFFAVSQPIPQEEEKRESLKIIINTLMVKGPDMITLPLQEIPDGPTPLHLMVVKETTSEEDKTFRHIILKDMLKRADSKKVSIEQCTDSICKESLLNVAARTLDISTIKLLLKNGVCFDSCNQYGDNMYHSLIRYALVYPERESKIKLTMESIAIFLDKNRNGRNLKSRIGLLFPDSLWRMRNSEGLTPLQLTAKLGRFVLFEHIIKQRAYRIHDGEIGNFDDVAYDVTEIDTVPTADGGKNHNSVLYILKHQPTDESTIRFLGLNIVGKTISAKWESYKFGYRIWTLLHFLIMCLYSWQAIVRTRLENPVVKAKATSSDDNKVTFVIASGSITVMYGVLCVLKQSISGIRYRLKNRGAVVLWSYGHIIFLLGICIIVDFIFMLTDSGYKNYVLPFTVIIGWYSMIYFLRVVEQFSFFTVLIRNVVANLIQFGIVMSFLLIGFSVAMFVVMQGAGESDEDDFQHIGKTFVKMFTVMLGIGEIGDLFNARDPVLAVIVFVLFVLMTTILLLNALIAIMSNTCSVLTTTTSSKAYVRLQKLHAILNLESMLPRRFLCPVAEEVKIVWHGYRSVTKYRRILSLRSEKENRITVKALKGENIPTNEIRKSIDMIETKL